MTILYFLVILCTFISFKILRFVFPPESDRPDNNLVHDEVHLLIPENQDMATMVIINREEGYMMKIRVPVDELNMDEWVEYWD